MVQPPPDINTHLPIIQTAYQQAFLDGEVLKSIAEKSAVLGIYFVDEDSWWHITIKNGNPAWHHGQPDAPDVWVSYQNAKIFHTQFHDPEQFMEDALQGAIEFHGSTEAAVVFQTMAVAFQTAYLAHTSQ